MENREREKPKTEWNRKCYLSWMQFRILNFNAYFEDEKINNKSYLFWYIATKQKKLVKKYRNCHLTLIFSSSYIFLLPLTMGNDLYAKTQNCMHNNFFVFFLLIGLRHAHLYQRPHDLIFGVSAWRQVFQSAEIF